MWTIILLCRNCWTRRENGSALLRSTKCSWSCHLTDLYLWRCLIQTLSLSNKVSWEVRKRRHMCISSLSLSLSLSLLLSPGPIIVTEKGKEIQKTCFLFTTHIALADKTQNHHVIFTEVRYKISPLIWLLPFLRPLQNAMISLVGATLYENVDLGGQIMQPDIKSGINAFQVVISAPWLSSWLFLINCYIICLVRIMIELV